MWQEKVERMFSVTSVEKSEDARFCLLERFQQYHPLALSFTLLYHYIVDRGIRWE
jgi:hypothetical protein